jgi:hemoglobin
MGRKGEGMRIKLGSLRRLNSRLPLLACVTLVSVVYLLGCGSTKPGTKKEDFFTSGSREADQRASQTMAKNEQLTGSGEGAGEKNVKKASAPKPDEPKGTNLAAQAENKLALFDRLGAEAGISNIVADFVPRALEDPRVNWERKNVSRRKFKIFGGKNSNSAQWRATPENVATLKKHMIQFISLATGGPAQYDGKEIKITHANMNISNPEFDAVIGDLKASLDRLKIPNKEQKELLAIIESTRPEIVTQR